MADPLAPGEPEGLEEDFLDGVLDIRCVPEDPPGDPDDHGAVLIDKCIPIDHRVSPRAGRLLPS